MIYGIKSKRNILVSKGFTLIELMVVIAIIAILTAIITANFTTAKSKSRDAKRMSDLGQIQLALAGYFDRCNTYPPDITTSFTTTCSGSGNVVSLSSFISKIPTPPTASESYYYIADLATPDDYFLEATLENKGASSSNSLAVSPSWYTNGYTTSYGSVVPGPGTIPTNLSCSSVTTVFCVGPR